MAAYGIYRTAATSSSRQSAYALWMQQSSLAAKSISENIMSSTETPSDALLIATVAVAVGSGEHIDDSIRIHPQSPLAKACSAYNLHTLAADPKLYDGARMLLSRKGWFTGCDYSVV